MKQLVNGILRNVTVSGGRDHVFFCVDLWEGQLIISDSAAFTYSLNYLRSSRVSGISFTFMRLPIYFQKMKKACEWGQQEVMALH